MIDAIVHGTVLSAGGALHQADVYLADGKIAAVGTDAAPKRRRLDARGLFVLPGIVDVHGDAFERSLMPRPGVTFDHGVALAETDRAMVAHGITTGYLGLTVSWEPGLRSLAAGSATMAALASARAHLAADFRIQIRWETFALDAVDMVIDWLDGDVPTVLAFNDHTTKTLENRTDVKKVQKWAERSGLTTDAYRTLVERVAEARDQVPEAVARLAAEARLRGTLLLSHDDQTREDRAYFRNLGVTVAEFPLTREAIEDARAHSESTVLGAPNVLRGGSHTGALDARDMIEAGLCCVLASDYFYPSLLNAPFKLMRQHGLALEHVWPLVSTGAADAMRLSDRGRIASGQRADLVIVDPSGPWPQAIATIVAGRIVHLARDIVVW